MRSALLGSRCCGRAAIGKRLLGLGLTAGIGYDRFSSEVGYGFRAPGGTVASQAG